MSAKEYRAVNVEEEQKATASEGQQEQAHGPRVLEWQYMRGPEFEQLDRANTVVCVSCSPMEVHGPHLPVNTDYWEAEGITTRMIERMAESHPETTFVRLPPIYVATDVVPMRGSIKFRSSTIVRVLEDLGRSLGKQGFHHIWISSFHGGPRHFVALEKGCARSNRRYGTRMVSMFSLLINRLTSGNADLTEVLGGLNGIEKQDLVGDTHGGAIETSMMLYLLGHHVSEDYAALAQRTVALKLAEEGKPSLQESGRPKLGQLLLGFREKLKYYETESYAGKPSVASPALGEQIVDLMAGYAAEAGQELLSGKLALKDCHSPLWKVRWIFTNETVGWLFEKIMRYRTKVW